MAIAQVTAGARIVISQLNAYYNLLKGVAGSGEQITLVQNADAAIAIQPSSDPAAGTHAISIKNNAGTVLSALTFDGKVEAADGTVALPGLTFDDDPDTGLYRSGANTVDVSAGGVRAAQFSTVASAVNYLDVAPSATGNAITLTAEGTDTNISVNIVPKGTGGVGLIKPTIADFTNAQHDHGDADDGGATVSALVSAVARVETAESTSSSTDTGYVDLATAGPAVTITTGTKALVTVGARIQSATNGANSFMGIDVSGATTRAAINDTAVGFIQEASGSAYLLASRTTLMTGLTAGSNTFTAKYRHVSGGASTSQFVLREISVIDLGS